jgi:hypothetical protein
MMKKVKIFLLFLTVIFGIPYSTHEVMAQPPCTAMTLLKTSSCDQEWSKYKEGYEKCVLNSAYHWFQELNCKAESLEKLNQSCKSCEFQFRKIQEKTENPQIQSSGSLHPDEERLVYEGPSVKCYNIKFIRQTGEYRFYIKVWVDNDFKDTLDGAGESTDVCGNKIVVKGEGYSARAYWEATEIPKLKQ